MAGTTLKATLNINGIYKIGGMGILLVLATISPGYVRAGFNYKIISNNARIDINIKSLENNFCPYEFQHPHSNIIAHVLISGCGYTDLNDNMILEPI